MATPIPIDCTVITGKELQDKIHEVEQIPIPPGPNLRDPWIQCTIKNETQFPIALGKRHLPVTASFHIEPDRHGPPFSQIVIVSSNGDSTEPASPSGVAFRLTLDNQQHFYDVALGWTIADAKMASMAGVVESSDPKRGADSVQPEDTKIISSVVFEGHGTEGRPVRLQFQSSATPGRQTLYVIKQIKPVA